MKISYRIDEAQAATGLGRTTIYKLINEKKLEVAKVGGRTLITARSLQALIEAEAA